MNASTSPIQAPRNRCRHIASQPMLSCAKRPTKSSHERSAQVSEMMPFVERIARRVSRDIRGKIELEELIAWGVTGLLEAIDRFEEGHNASLKTFAFYRIRGAMLDSIGKLAPLTRSGYRCAGQVGDFHAIYRSHLESSDILDTEQLTQEDHFAQRQQYQVLERAMNCLSKDHRHLVQEHYFGDKTLKAAGADLGKSKSWACRSHVAALEALRQAMESPAALAA